MDELQRRKQQARESVEDVFQPALCLEKECECEHPFKNTPPDLGASLDTAKATITGERQDQYGNPEDSFAIIAGYWEVYLANRKPGPLTALDTAHMMTLFKIARCTGQAPKRDNYIDGQGYLAIAADRLIPAMEGVR